MNKKSSYFRLFSFSMFILITITVVAIVIMVTISSLMYKHAKLSDLKTRGDTFISFLKSSYHEPYEVNSSDAQILHKELEEEYGLTIRIYDSQGNCVLSADTYGNDIKAVEPLSADTMEALKEEPYLDFDTSGFSSNQPHILYGNDFFLKNGSTPTSTQRMYAMFYVDSDQINIYTVKMTLFYSAFAAAGFYLYFIINRKKMKKYAEFESECRRIGELYSKGKFDEKLQTNISGLPKEVAEYMNSLASCVEKSEDVSKTFIANVSHELRTPITTVGGFVDGILDGTIPKSRQNEYLVLVSNEIHRLKILISSMLNMSRFESGTLSPNFRETNLTDLVIQTVLMFEKKIEDKNLNVEGLGEGRVVAIADADLMQQVFYNLIENAVKFIDDGGTLSFRFETVDGICTVAIRNTGEGLKNSEIEQVFNRFYKTDSSRGKDTTGLGLGLSISRKIVHLHSGHIVVKSVYGEYTEFLVQIPEKGPQKKG